MQQSMRLASVKGARMLSTKPITKNQRLLPRLPLPSLEDTLQRYLKAAEPVVEPDQFVATSAVVSEALAEGSELRKLQAQLSEADGLKRDASFIAVEWDDMYLKGRWPLPLNSNPGWVSETSVFPENATTQVQRAARMVAATTKVALKVETGTLSPDLFKGKIPVDMRQYSQMFAATRLPARDRDRLHKAPPCPPPHATVPYIAVLRGADFWRVPVLDAAGDPLSVRALEGMLQTVCDATDAASATASARSDRDVATPSLAALTTLERDSWADARAALASHSPLNAASLAVLDDSLFHLCLDVGDAVEADTDAAVREGLCGHPATAPRWFDKSLSLMLSSDGVPMGQFEHAWGDGISILRCGSDSFATILQGTYPTSMSAPCSDATPEPELLRWDVPHEVEDLTERAAGEYTSLCSALSMACIRFERWGVDAIKQWGLSPDGTVQAALQLANFNTNGGRTVSTYESASTAHFSAGRTETIRSASAQSAAFVRAAANGASPAEQLSLLRASTERHSELAREAASGQGIDRHLYALRCLGPSAALFTDPTYTAVTSNELSTSTLTDPYSRQAAFGPVHAGGYGVSYHLPKTDLRFCVTTYAPREAKAFAANLERALMHIEELCTAEE